MTRIIGRQEREAILAACSQGGWLMTMSSIRLERGSPLILGSYHLGPYLLSFCWRGELLCYDPEMA